MDPIQVVSLFLKDPYSWPAACLIIGNLIFRQPLRICAWSRIFYAKSTNTVAGRFLIRFNLPEDWLIFSTTRRYLRSKQVGIFNECLSSSGVIWPPARPWKGGSERYFCCCLHPWSAFVDSVAIVACFWCLCPVLLSASNVFVLAALYMERRLAVVRPDNGWRCWTQAVRKAKAGARAPLFDHSPTTDLCYSAGCLLGATLNILLLWSLIFQTKIQEL